MAELRPVPDYPNIFADDNGTVWITKDGNIVPAKTHLKKRTGYRFVNVKHASGKRVPVEVHRLVCLAWHGVPPPNTQTRHLSGDKTDSRPSNLAWGSARQNCEDRARHGRTLAGENHPGASFTSEMVIGARYMAAAGVAVKVIAAYFGAPANTVYQIVTGLTWKSVGGPIRERKGAKARVDLRQV